MALQEMMVSFGVDVDQAGLTRLNQALTDGRRQAAAYAGAFRQAEDALKSWLRTAGLAGPGTQPAATARLAGLLSVLSGSSGSRSSALTGFPGFLASGFSSGLSESLASLLSGFSETLARAPRNAREPAVPAAGDTDGSPAGETAALFSSLLESLRGGLPREPEASGAPGAQPGPSLAGNSATREAEPRRAPSPAAPVSLPAVLPLPETEPFLAAIRDALATVSATPLPLHAGTDAFLREIRQALARARQAAASTPLTLKIGVRLDPGGSGKGLLSWTLKQYAAGGRVSRPTLANLAEDGNPEYVIPIRKEARALPLIRQMLSELSAGARQSLAGISGHSGSAGAAGTAAPLPASLTAVSPGITVHNSYNVSAPCTVHLNAPSADPARVADALYSATDAHLLRALRSVW